MIVVEPRLRVVYPALESSTVDDVVVIAVEGSFNVAVVDTPNGMLVDTASLEGVAVDVRVVVVEVVVELVVNVDVSRN